MKRLGVLLVTVGVATLALLMGAVAHADSPQDSAVGSITTISEHAGLTVTTTLQAFSNPDGSSASGFFTFETTGPSGGTGNFSAHVTCLRVSGNQATVGFVIDHASGAASGLVGTADVDFIQDNGLPVHSQAVDRQDLNPNTGYTGGATCPAWQYPKFLALRGNFTVTDT